MSHALPLKIQMTRVQKNHSSSAFASLCPHRKKTRFDCKLSLSFCPSFRYLLPWTKTLLMRTVPCFRGSRAPQTRVTCFLAKSLHCRKLNLEELLPLASRLSRQLTTLRETSQTQLLSLLGHIFHKRGKSVSSPIMDQDSLRNLDESLDRSILSTHIKRLEPKPLVPESPPHMYFGPQRSEASFHGLL